MGISDDIPHWYMVIRVGSENHFVIVTCFIDNHVLAVTFGRRRAKREKRLLFIVVQSTKIDAWIHESKKLSNKIYL